MKEKMKKILGAVLSIFPKKKIILFQSSSDFTDSSKSLYDFCIKNRLDEKYKLVWLVSDDKNDKYIKENNINIVKNTDKFKKFYYYAFSKYCFYTHGFCGIPNNKNQIRYFLTHAALPIKNSKGCFWDYRYNTFIETTSDFTKKYRCETFGGGEDRAKTLGLPRNDELFIKDDSKEKLGLNKYSKIILWMPTFKHHQNKLRNDFGSEQKNDISLLEKDTLNNINKYLKKYNMCLILKFHPAQDMNFIKTMEYSNIKFLTNKDLQNKDIVLYRLLGQCDALITDFSSVYIDYLLVNKPIAFELADKTKYEKGIGFTLENPLDYMPGEKILNKEDFIKFIKNINDNNDVYKEEREELLKLTHKYKDGSSSKRILSFLGLLPKNK